MWLLDHIPPAFLLWIVYGTFIAGIVAYVLSFFSAVIPAISLYKTPLHFISLVLLTLGVYLYGCNDTEVYWRQKVADSQVAYKKEIDAATIELKKATEDIILEKKKTQDAINAQHIIIRNQILTITERIDSGCIVDPLAIKVLNDASVFPAKGLK